MAAQATKRIAWFRSRAQDHIGQFRFLRMLPSGSVGAEIGVWRGDFSARILRWARPSRLVLVDPWRFTEDEDYKHAMFGGASGGQAEMDEVHAGVVTRFKERLDAGQVVIRREPSVEAAQAWQDGPLDWVYIDGDHTYDGVRADLHAYWPLLKAGGVMAGDDYAFPGWWKDGVTLAVNEFAAEQRLTLKVMGSQFLLRKPAA